MNIKIYLPDTAEKPREVLSREVQEHAFRLGYKWLSVGKYVQPIDEFFLTIYKGCKLMFHDKCLSYSSEFLQGEYSEMTPEEFLEIPIPVEKKKEDTMNYKMYLPDTVEKPREELSREVQEHAFKLGCEWMSGEEFVDLNKPFIIIKEKKMSYMNYWQGGNFYNLEVTELTPEQFLNLPIPEPVFDESKVITWANRHEAVIGQEYRYGDNLYTLKSKDEPSILTDISDENISYPFYVNESWWSALYPVGY